MVSTRSWKEPHIPLCPECGFVPHPYPGLCWVLAPHTLGSLGTDLDILMANETSHSAGVGVLLTPRTATRER